MEKLYTTKIKLFVSCQVKKMKQTLVVNKMIEEDTTDVSDDEDVVDETVVESAMIMIQV